jgi:hypothetical protein
MEIDLVKYNTEESILFDDILNNKLSLNDARERCVKLWKLIPYDTDINPVRLNNLMKEKYGNELDFYKYSKIYTINVSNNDEISIEEYIINVANKIKSK